MDFGIACPFFLLYNIQLRMETEDYEKRQEEDR